MSTICELTMNFTWFDARDLSLNTAISSVCDLSVMKSRYFFDLLSDEIECVHRESPEVRVCGPRSFSRLRPSKTDERSVPRLTCVPKSGMNDRSIIDPINYLVK